SSTVTRVPPPRASRVPSGEKARHLPARDQVRISLPLATSHRRVPDLPMAQDAPILPSGLTATPSPPGSKRRNSFPVATSQIRRPSSPLERTLFPSGVKATSVIDCVCPFPFRRSLAVSTSQNFTS